VVHGGGVIRIPHYDVIDDVHNSETIDREKRRPPRPMTSSELSNGENRIAHITTIFAKPEITSFMKS